MNPQTATEKASSPAATPSFGGAGALFHRKRHRLDFVRNPYGAWAFLCVMFLLLVLAAIGLDGSITWQLQAGTLVAKPPAAEVPPPIIDQVLLINTAQLYIGRAATLQTLQSAVPPIADPASAN